MTQPSLAVFAYNFPHRKTQDFLLRLMLEGWPVRLVLAADPVPLGIPPSSIRGKLRDGALVHPRQVAERIGAEYRVVPHNGPEVEAALREAGAELGVIAGARILKRGTIEACGGRIVNFHPGLIPQARGLDALLWSVLQGHPPGVTAHLIDHRVDAGGVLLRRTIRVHPDDTLFDLNGRLYDTQLEMLDASLRAALAGPGEPVDPGTPYNRKMPPELEQEVLRRLPEYVLRMSGEAQSAAA